MGCLFPCLLFQPTYVVFEISFFVYNISLDDTGFFLPHPICPFSGAFRLFTFKVLVGMLELKCAVSSVCVSVSYFVFFNLTVSYLSIF